MKLLLTRPLEQSKSLKEKLEANGFEVECLPLIEIRPPSDGGTSLQKALENISQYQWIVFTSQNAVLAVAKYCPSLPQHLKVVVIGPKTAGVAQDLGWKTRSLKQEQVTSRESRVTKILYPRSNIGLDKWVLKLQNAGAKVDVVEAYKTEPAKVPQSAWHYMVVEGVDAILFFSPSAVQSFVMSLRGAKATEQSSDHRDCFAALAMTSLIPFGPTTAKALAENGFKPAFVPSRSDEETFVKELKEFFKSQE